MKKIKNNIFGYLIALIALLAVGASGMLFVSQASQPAHADRVPGSVSEEIIGDLFYKFMKTVDGHSWAAVSAINTSISGGLNIPASVIRNRDNKEYNVEEIYNDGFKNCALLESVVLPEPIRSIGNRAFQGCTSLQSVTISGNNIKYIYSEAFQGCNSLKSITIPNSVTYIGSAAFSTTSLETIFYEGTSAQWAEISKQPDSILSSTNIVCLLDIPNDISANVSNYGETNEIVTVTYSGYEVSGYYSKSSNSYPDTSDIAFDSGRDFTEEGYYRVEARNNYGEPAVTYFKIDRTSPTGILNGVADDGYTKKNVTFTWTEAGATATLNGSAYTSGQTISAEGTHTIVLTDRAGNSTTYSFTIDKTPPTGTLAGVTNDGYTNGNVTFTWTESGCTATLNGSSYTSGRTISAEGTHTIVLTDRAGNSTTYTFTIDKTPPTGTLAGVTNDGYTNGNVTFTWTESGCTATLNGSSYTSGRTISAEGTHTIVLTDRAGNSTTYTFTIDKTPPTGTLAGVTNDGYTNGNVTFTWTESGCTATLNGSSYTSGRTISAEGTHTIVLTDRAGNSTTYSFTIDKTAPVIDAYSTYTNAAFTMTAQDKYCNIGAWEYKLDSGEIKRSNTQALTLGGTAAYNGVWDIRVIDELGNTSAWVNVKHAYRETFGNFEGIYNSFFVPSYYVVTLSQKNYTNCFGAYTFADYSAALRFAVNKEWDCRVIELDGGKSWNYVNPTNENTRQIYTDRAELDSVIDKYARKNIGDRKVIGKNGAVLNNPTDGTGVTRADALTQQLTELPGLLSAYAGYRYMLALPSYSLTMPQAIVNGNRATATIQFISDGISLRIGAEKALNYGDSISTAMNAEGEQGWYLITERDVCGNVEKYLIFIDVQQPELYANVKYGNTNKDLINFNQDFIDGNKQAMRYIEFSVSSLSDNIDDFVMVSIEGRNAGLQYVWGDEIPVLNYENGYHGAYTITVYDRSRNALEFTIYIAGEAPSLRYTSLTNETSCTFTIQINDSFNEITDIKFYKIHFGGEEERIYADSFDTPIDAQNLVYKMTVGGKFVFEFTDLYGRTVRTNPVFYMKGLPSATLRGVKDGGLTKNDVGIIYDTDATCELYILKDGVWESTELYETVQGITTNTISITAGKETTAIYKVLLYKTADRNLFTEYTFEIDGIPPIVGIYTERGEEIIPETVTTQNFYITWQESGYKAYYKKSGAISDMQYTKETIITAAGSYVFTVYDSARNELTFNVTLDNSVSYTLEGTYTILEDGSYITKNNLVFTVTEPYSEFTVQSSNGMTVVNGKKFDTDGTYIIDVKDMYGNAFSLTIIIDKLPPEPIILTETGIRITDGSRTRENFSVSSEEENVVMSVASGSGAYIVYNGTLITELGTYTFRLSDRVGNSSTVTVTIDREVQYRIDGNYTLIDGEYCSRNWLMVVPSETLTVFEIQAYDGTVMDNTKRISEEGKYNVTLKDVAGNEVQFPIVIDKSAPTVTVVLASGNYADGRDKINESFRLECKEEGATLTYSFNGSAAVAYNGETLSEQGEYAYTATDVLGNSATSVIVIDKEVKYRIDGNYTVIDGKYYSRSWMLVTPSEETQTFVIVTADGSLVDTDRRITAEGTYSVTITDVAGNTVELGLVINKSAPVVTVLTESGKELNGGAVNEAFKIVCGQSDVSILFTSGNGEYIVYDGRFIRDAGTYTFRITDRIGNMSEISVIVNYEVAFSVQGSYTFKDGKYYSKSWLLVVPEEAVTDFIIEDGNGELIDADKRITAEGEYTAIITDTEGNSVKLVLVIDKTAPEVIFETETGKRLTAGDTTNERFKIICIEADSVLTYSHNGTVKTAYYGDWLKDEGVYTVTVSDFLGNVAEFKVTVDKSVSLTVNGSYVKDENGAYISNDWLSVAADETMKTLEIISSDGTVIDVDGRITAEGIYSLFAEDMYGNELELTLIVDKTPPEIILNGVEADGATNTSVTVSFTDYAEAYYRFGGGDKTVLTADSVFDAEGKYTVIARDLAGNSSTVTFEIDLHVDAEPSIPLVYGCMITGSVSFKFKEEVSAKLYCGEEEIVYERGEISRPGEYTLKAVDACGNERTFGWRILPAKARSYSFFVGTEVSVIVELNGGIITAPFDGDNLNLTETGHYLMRFNSSAGSWTLELEVDNVAPEVMFENTRTSVKIFSPNKEGIKYTLYKDGVKTSFNLKNSVELTQTGNYRLVCEDEVGNITEYVFTLNYLSDISIILIVVLCALVLAGTVTIIILRFTKKRF